MLLSALYTCLEPPNKALCEVVQTQDVQLLLGQL